MILLDENTRALVQGITGKQGTFHTEQMLDYGTNILAGVTPGKGGRETLGLPVYNTIEEAKDNFNDLNTSIIFVPGPFAKDAAIESLTHMDCVILITEHIPVHDTMEIMEYARRLDKVVIGPNTPGVISPGVGKLGIMPTNIFSQGSVGLISRSGTLTYEVASELTNAGFGQSTCVGIGGDPVIGTDYIGVLEMFEDDPGTDSIVLIGEIGGDADDGWFDYILKYSIKDDGSYEIINKTRAAEYIRDNVSKPVVSFVAGRSAPPGKRMGHAGAIISGDKGTVNSKVTAFTNVGVSVASRPSEVPQLLRKVL